eukprot:TRINITY_DN8762_c0_g1_i1.p1 TRINITY_DN8762_c0_g1~~TRINITY_DN8762_c0_g1_i1.p1  ORF type:complete len:409 (-),score=28.35 TRINITY_DN8762_c0_g1_i1:19-1245(-)
MATPVENARRWVCTITACGPETEEGSFEVVTACGFLWTHTVLVTNSHVINEETTSFEAVFAGTDGVSTVTCTKDNMERMQTMRSGSYDITIIRLKESIDGVTGFGTAAFKYVDYMATHLEPHWEKRREWWIRNVFQEVVERGKDLYILFPNADPEKALECRKVRKKTAGMHLSVGGWVPPGASGAPVFTEDGVLIGVAYQTRDGNIIDVEEVTCALGLFLQGIFADLVLTRALSMHMHGLTNTARSGAAVQEARGSSENYQAELGKDQNRPELGVLVGKSFKFGCRSFRGQKFIVPTTRVERRIREIIEDSDNEGLFVEKVIGRVGSELIKETMSGGLKVRFDCEEGLGRGSNKLRFQVQACIGKKTGKNDVIASATVEHIRGSDWSDKEVDAVRKALLDIVGINDTK